mmetsp:Transcript_10563/g.39824  ORF Transcript_10563/g.39824 Transcript_10563/m.39824 type:complete len:502 (+) Transcript_10563:989-2494(+)
MAQLVRRGEAVLRELLQGGPVDRAEVVDDVAQVGDAWVRPSLDDLVDLGVFLAFVLELLRHQREDRVEREEIDAHRVELHPSRRRDDNIVHLARGVLLACQLLRPGNGLHRLKRMARRSQVDDAPHPLAALPEDQLSEKVRARFRVACPVQGDGFPVLHVSPKAARVLHDWQRLPVRLRGRCRSQLRSLVGLVVLGEERPDQQADLVDPVAQVGMAPEVVRGQSIGLRGDVARLEDDLRGSASHVQRSERAMTAEPLVRQVPGDPVCQVVDANAGEEPLAVAADGANVRSVQREGEVLVGAHALVDLVVGLLLVLHARESHASGRLDVDSRLAVKALRNQRLRLHEEVHEVLGHLRPRGLPDVRRQPWRYFGTFGRPHFNWFIAVGDVEHEEAGARAAAIDHDGVLGVRVAAWRSVANLREPGERPLACTSISRIAGELSPETPRLRARGCALSPKIPPQRHSRHFGAPPFLRYKAPHSHSRKRALVFGPENSNTARRTND